MSTVATGGTPFWGSEFAGKSVFVTGAGAGLGKAIALELAGAGAKLSLLDRSADTLEKTAKEIRGLGAECITFTGDVTDAATVKKVVQQTASKFGRLDLAVNNAGILGELTGVENYPPETFRRVLDVNVMGVFLCLQAEAQVMLAQGGGAIVNIASVAGLIGWGTATAYVASKHAVVGFTKTAALELAKRGVRVNCVCPTFIMTDLTVDFLGKPEVQSAAEAVIPAGQLGTPQSVADTTLWLLSSRASFMHGAAVAVDGGYTAQ